MSTDAKRHAFDSVTTPPTSGASLELTLDAALQHVVERELARGVAEHRADSGVAIVMDPWTGEVLAMASVPTFNPNAFGDADANHRRNLGVPTPTNRARPSRRSRPRPSFRNAC